MLFLSSRIVGMSFIMAGIPALVGAALMTPIRFMRDECVDDNVCDKQTEDQFNKLFNKPAWTEGLFMDSFFFFFF